MAINEHSEHSDVKHFKYYIATEIINRKGKHITQRVRRNIE